MKIKIFADAGDSKTLIRLAENPRVRGFTTNPTLARAGGVRDYATFVQETLHSITDRPISFEVLADTLPDMERQARIIAGFGENVYVKIPVMTTDRTETMPIVQRLAQDGIKVNVTAVFTHEQVRRSCDALRGGAPSVVSVFAGRIADAGVDPVPHMKIAREICGGDIELLWASPREVFNVLQADECGCDIITITDALLAKVSGFGKDLTEFSLDTVKMFRNDALAAGYDL